MIRNSLCKKINQRADYHPFTLIELMVVIVIMLVVLGIATPAFKSMISGNAVDRAAQMLSTQLRLARATAIAENRYIAVVFPQGHFRTPAAVTEQYNYQAFRIAVVEPPAAVGGHFTLAQWYPGSNWMFLPTGAVLAEVNDSVISPSAPATPTATYELVYAGTAPNATGDFTVSYNVNDTNWLTQSGGNYTFQNVAAANCARIIDGSTALWDDDTVLAHDETVNNRHADHYYAACVVFNPKGRCCMASDGTTQDMYLTIVEGNVTGTQLTEANIYNMKVLKVGRLTGLCEYLPIGEN